MRTGAKPDLDALRTRLGAIEARVPALRKVRSMTLPQFAADLRRAAEDLREEDVQAELGALLPEVELAGVLPRMRSGLISLTEHLER